ncbi:MAG: LacI family DNA-binding transcriptional regulator [Rubrobacteraceae bacterium]|uniref:LacI family DNA-binding transcriptional regulator n=1 Tax=Rubrobacter naiadicus TaxID=1392641 RepID=UPI0023628A55|nr:LacI family DNA-binding transcriptional regulator [Rubrobacter naiadicus]MBX6764903.1 LacI family DNA-binding transcriptional regulator [Rubrobacteraceae bacterium]
MTRRVNIKDVAQRAGVSISTVSRVLNETDYPVKPETRAKVLEATKELGFKPNDLARGLLSSRTRIIGLIIPDISNPYYPELSLGVESTASEHGYSVVFCNTGRDAERLEQYVDVLLQKRADGIILAGGGTQTKQVSQVLSDFDLAVALIGRHNLPFPSVQIDNRTAAREATSHLLELGHRRVAFISGPLNLTSVQDRLAGYQEAMVEHGIEHDSRLIREGDFGVQSGYSAAMALLKGQPRPTAIFAANDRMATSVISAAIDLGLRVPEDLSVVGFDNTVLASQVRPSLTTVSVPAYEMGSAAMKLLIDTLSGKKCPQVVWLSTELVIRQSTGPPSEGDQSEVHTIEKKGER